MTVRSAMAISSVRAAAHELRFTAEIVGEPHEIWVHSSLPVVPGADVALALTLVMAMTRGGRLEVGAPVDETLIRRIPEIQAVLRSFNMTGDWTPAGPIKHRIEVVCPTSSPPPRRDDRGIAAFFSCGVDSFSTVVRNPEITHLIYVAGLDAPVGEEFEQHHAQVRGAVEAIGERLGKSVITVETNARELYEGLLEGPAFFGGVLAAAARLVAPEIARVYIASSQSYEWQLENSSHPMLDHLWGSGGVEVIHEGAELTRPEKLEGIAADTLARSALRVCWAGTGSAYNCCRCEKCLRTMVALEALGVLAKFETFPFPLDLEAVAATRLLVRHEVAYWRENLGLALRRGAADELVEAIEACLAKVDPAARARPRRSDLPNPKAGSERMLFLSPGTRLELQGKRAVVFAVGSYDGSGNYGDIAQLQAAVEMLDGLADEVAVVPVLELGQLVRHRELGLAATRCFDPDRVLGFDLAGDPAEPAATALGLVPATLPVTIEHAVTYLYGGGYLNSRWAGRKMAMAEAVGALVARTGVSSHQLISSGLQIDPEWAGGAGARHRKQFSGLDLIGVRDPLSRHAAGDLAEGPGEPPVVLTGDDAVGVIAPVAEAPTEPRATEALTVNVHLCGEGWVTDDRQRQLEFISRLLAALGQESGVPVDLQPVIAYEDSRISERPGITRLTAALRDAGSVRVVADPLVLRPAAIAAQAKLLRRADLTVGFSYHVVLTSLMLGVPAALLCENEYYAQKAAGLRADFSLPGELLPTTDGDPAEAAARVIALITDPQREPMLRSDLDLASRRVVARRSEVEGQLRARLDRGLERSRAGVDQQAGGGFVADEDYRRLLRIHRATTQRLDDLSRLVEWQGSRLGDIESSASWRWTGSLRAAAKRLRRGVRRA
jgi:polysaccharide pyruvyl transferase WcaK-like protein